MLLNVSYVFLAIMVAVAWVLNTLLNLPNASLSESDWNDLVTKPLVKNGNTLFYILLSIPVAWFLNNFYLFGYSLSILTWIVRILLAFDALHALFCCVLSLSILNNTPGRRMLVSNLLLAAVSIVCLLSI